VFAIKSAIEYIYLENATSNKDIVILTDSKSAIQEIGNNVINVYKNMYICDIRRYIELLSRYRNVNTVIAWIPAHVGIRGNEIADKLAKEATEEPACDEIVVPIGDFRKGFRKETWKETQKRIKREGSYKGKRYMERFYEENRKKPWFQKINTERYFITLINRLKANHYKLGVSLKRKGYTDNEECECGWSDETLEHVIWRCARFDEERVGIDERMRRAGITEDIDIWRIIENKRWNVFGYIDNFIKKIKRII